MIEPTDMNGSTSVKKFTSPVCGQRSFDSIWLPLATRTIARTRRTKGRSGQRDHKRCRSVTDASRARYLAVLRVIRGASRGVVTIRRATDWQSLMTSCMNRACSLQNSNGEWQRAIRIGSSRTAVVRRPISPSTSKPLERGAAPFPASPFRALSGLSLQFPLASGITLSIERCALSAPCLPGSPMGFALPSFALLLA